MAPQAQPTSGLNYRTAFFEDSFYPEGIAGLSEAAFMKRSVHFFTRSIANNFVGHRIFSRSRVQIVCVYSGYGRYFLGWPSLLQWLMRPLFPIQERSQS